jgi:3-hydroxyisobutyrate dehydrogenase-like beta-hydroxyacid dehydrogenase
MAEVGFVGLRDMGQVIFPRLPEAEHEVQGCSTFPWEN